MKYVITGRNIEVTPRLRDMVESKLGKLERYFNQDTEVLVTLSVEKDRNTIEVTIPVKGTIIRAEETSDDMFVSIDVVDKNGIPCPDAAIDCEAIVKGQGRLLSFASADLKDTEPYTSPRVKTWKGRALLVVRSTQKKGSINITIKSSLPAASLTLKSK